MKKWSTQKIIDEFDELLQQREQEKENITMTRKDFQAVADMIKAMDIPRTHKEQFALGMCRIFQQKNPRFKLQRFMKACGLGE